MLSVHANEQWLTLRSACTWAPCYYITCQEHMLVYSLAEWEGGEPEVYAILFMCCENSGHTVIQHSDDQIWTMIRVYFSPTCFQRHILVPYCLRNTSVLFLWAPVLEIFTTFFCFDTVLCKGPSFQWRYFFLFCFYGFILKWQLETWQETGWERRGDAARVGFEPRVAAVRTQPLYMECTLYQLSYCDASLIYLFNQGLGLLNANSGFKWFDTKSYKYLKLI